MTRLFVSYARKDGRELADRIANDARLHDVWLDTREIGVADDWTSKIERAIDDCDVFLALLTVQYFQSDIGRKELTRAYAASKRLIPIVVHPKADVPLLINTLQRIDFTDSSPLALEPNMLRLIDAIDHPPAPEPPRPGMLEWSTTVARAAGWARRFVGNHDLTFNADLYARRVKAEQELAKFVAEDGCTLIVLGDSGVGKTNLLCRWTLDVIEQGHAVLVYDCSTLPDSDIEKQIARDLKVPEDDLIDALERIDAEAAEAGRKLILVFEALGDFRTKTSGPEDLLKAIKALAGRVLDQTRVVLSCNAATWNRMQRSRPIRLDRSRCIELDVFTDEELEQAYALYRKFFNLRFTFEQIGPAVRKRLHEPVLLRMMAEAFGKSNVPLPPANLAEGLYKRFFDERVTSIPQAALVDQLAAEMLRQKTSTLSVRELALDARLGPELRREDDDSPYFRLLDCGVLQEQQIDERDGTLIKFAHTRLAAYAIASYLWKQSKDVRSTAADLVTQDAGFPLAWEIAKTLLLISRDRNALTALAVSDDSEQRELAAEALVELDAEDAAQAREILESLFRQDRQEGRRTALKAAYNIGPGVEDFFLHAAMEGAPLMREAVQNTLYLIWRRSSTEAYYLVWKQSPEFTYEILMKLLDELRPLNLVRAPAIFKFVVDLTITIYINHCDDQMVRDKTSEVLHKLWIDRLHLNVPGEWFEQILATTLGAVFGKPILEWMLFNLTAKEFFALPQEDRDRLGRIGDLFDPYADVAAAHDDVVQMLRSNVPIFRGSAAMAVAVHACKDFAKTKPLIETLWNELAGDGRLWLLAGFSVLIKDTPDEWVPLLEGLTRSYVTEHRDAFLGKESVLPGDLDVIFLPLGLAYGKRPERSMPFFDELVRDAMTKGDTAMLSRCVAALGIVGFYYPEAMLEVLRPLMARVDSPAIRTMVVGNLAVVRTLHFDAVDRFLHDAGAPRDLRHDVDAAADVELVRRYIRALGYYNNAVHFTLKYPRMRKPLSTGALKLLATVDSAKQFVSAYTGTSLKMLRDANYEVLNWTLPE